MIKSTKMKVATFKTLTLSSKNHNPQIRITGYAKEVCRIIFLPAKSGPGR